MQLIHAIHHWVSVGSFGRKQNYIRLGFLSGSNDVIVGQLCDEWSTASCPYGWLNIQNKCAVIEHLLISIASYCFSWANERECNMYNFVEFIYVCVCVRSTLCASCAKTHILANIVETTKVRCVSWRGIYRRMYFLCGSEYLCVREILPYGTFLWLGFLCVHLSGFLSTNVDDKRRAVAVGSHYDFDRHLWRILNVVMFFCMWRIYVSSVQLYAQTNIHIMGLCANGYAAHNGESNIRNENVRMWYVIMCWLQIISDISIVE